MTSKGIDRKSSERVPTNHALKKRLFIASLAFLLSGVMGCEIAKENNSDDSGARVKQTDHSEESTNTEIIVETQLFSADIPDFNVMPEGDIADENGNTWFILESDTYKQLMIQITLQNKKSLKRPGSYSLEDLGLREATIETAHFHGFKEEKFGKLEDARGAVYQFETEEIKGWLLFYSESEVTSKESLYFKKVIQSIKIANYTESTRNN